MNNNAAAPIDDETNQKQVPPVFVLFTFVMIIILQVMVQFWKKAHRKSYILTTFVLMWIFPIIFITMFTSSIKPFVRMLIIWCIYSAMTGWIFYLSFQKKLAKNTPKKVYAWFLLVYKLSHLVTMIGTVALALELLTGLFTKIRSNVLRDNSFLTFFVPMPHILLFYGLYYGVLVRDCAEMCAEAMSNSMHKEQHQYYLSQSFVDRNCGICGLALKPEDNSMPNNTFDIEGSTFTYDVNDEAAVTTRTTLGTTFTEKKHTTKQATKALSCGHKFHEFCLRGYMLVGKKDVCPFCNEKIEFEEISKHTKQPWQTDSLFYVQVLELVRYIMVWNPIIVIAIHCIFVLFFFIHFLFFFLLFFLLFFSFLYATEIA